MKTFFHRILRHLRSILHFSDEIDYANASASIKKGIAFRGTNVFILACAIIIASLGLNVNSIPVIIGAMLVSPVMGPILGFGLGLATEDNHLLKDSLINFAVMVGISIIASALFFLLSPLSLANPSELLARTNPTIYDVLIALFGGLAGIIAISRKDKGTVISGVAIATALMPPLCTVGYGLSIWNWHYVLGAFYLFIINSIFISLATFLAVKYFHFPVVDSDELRHRLPKSAVYFILLIFIIPSILTAISVVKENNFKIHAEQVVKKNKNMGKCHIFDYTATYSRKSPSLELFLAGEKPSPEDKERLYTSAEELGITRNQIVFREDATIVREYLSEAEILKGIYEYNDRQIGILRDSIASLEAKLSDYKAKEIPVQAISRELFAQYPEITSLSLTQGASIAANDTEANEKVVAIISSEQPIDSTLHDRIERWLKVRLNDENVVVVSEKKD